MFWSRGVGWQAHSSCDLECWPWTKCVECPKTIPPNSRSPSSTVKHYLESKRSSILVYVSTRTWPGPLTLILSSLNVLKYLFFISEGSVQWMSTNPSFGELFLPVLSLLFYIAHQSFSLDCLIKTSPLFKKMYASAINFQWCSLYTYLQSSNLPSL